MTKISNGKVVIEVPDDKAFHYCLAMGYHIVQDDTPDVAEVPIEDTRVAPRRGRPSKKAS